MDAIPPAPAGATNIRIASDNPVDSHLENLREETQGLISRTATAMKKPPGTPSLGSLPPTNSLITRASFAGEGEACTSDKSATPFRCKIKSCHQRSRI
jgi:hypothetical protein